MEQMNNIFDANDNIKEEELCPDCYGYGFVIIEANKQLVRYGASEDIVAIRCHCDDGKYEDVFDQIVLK